MSAYQYPFTEAVLENITDETMTSEDYQERLKFLEKNNLDPGATEPANSIKEALVILQQQSQ